MPVGAPHLLDLAVTGLPALGPDPSGGVRGRPAVLHHNKSPHGWVSLDILQVMAITKTSHKGACAENHKTKTHRHRASAILAIAYLPKQNPVSRQPKFYKKKRRKLRYIELDSKQAFKQHFGGWLVTTDAFDLPRGVPGVQIHLPYLPLAQTSCRRRRTVITYYSNTPDHDSLRNPCWPVAATTEDQNRHKMAPESDGLVWTP